MGVPACHISYQQSNRVVRPGGGIVYFQHILPDHLTDVFHRFYDVTNSHMTNSRTTGEVTMNYFAIVCFVWAGIGIATRILMVAYGERWNRWEMTHAYAVQRPQWVVFVAGAGIVFIAFTWYKVFTTDVNHSWILATLVSLTSIKLSVLLFQYEKFRAFASEILNNKYKKMRLTVSVALMAIVLLVMGLRLY
jgi:hypothetical protein